MDPISIIIPAYNSAECLPLLIERLVKVLPTFETQYEVILVNDGSADTSWDVITHFAQDYPWLYGINLMRNYGQHNALLCGIRAAQYPMIVTMDDDLQHPPEEIPRLLSKLNEGYDVVYGTPQQQQHGFWRNFASRLIKSALHSAMGVKNARDVSAFRAFRTELRQAFETYHSPYASVDVLLSWATTRFSAVSVKHAPRAFGQSNYNFTKLVLQALNMLTGFSTVPLRLASMAGFGFMLFGILVLFYVIGRYFIEGYSIPGFPFLASTISIFSGVQLFALGIIGEYLARMHFRTMDRPTYVIRELTPNTTEEKENKLS
jgi:glycosyltransferase involved in cell wall biosynthesis